MCVYVMFEYSVDVVIPSAGCGERCFDGMPKQYHIIKDKPLFLHSVEAFTKLPYIRKVCIVSDNVEYTQHLIELHLKNSNQLLIVSGGKSRHESIKKGLHALSFDDTAKPHVVVVHDGARPIVEDAIVKKVIEAANSCGAAGATRPLTSTIVKPAYSINTHNKSSATLDIVLERSLYLASEMPQAFLFQLLHEAYQKCSENDLKHGTECLQLVLKYCGVRAKLIPGSETLWKVTNKRDCYATEAFLQSSSTRICVIAVEQSEIVNLMEKSLKYRVADFAIITNKQKKTNGKTYNTIICLHNQEINEENQLTSLSDVLDLDFPGLIIHVVFEENSEGDISGSVSDLLRSRRSMVKQYRKLNKGVVIIHVTNKDEDDKLLQIIQTLVLSNSTTFSGQTLFL